MKRTTLVSLVVIGTILFFPTTIEGFYTVSELSYKPRNAKGVHNLAEYLGGVSQVNLINGNLIFSRQLVSRPGRAGFNAGLGLFYNSKLWDRWGTRMVVPELGSTYGLGLGWTLTLGRLIEGNSTYAVVFPDGSSHEIVDYGGGDWKSVDSSYLRLDIANKVATLPGGTQLTYGHTTGNTHHLTRITDRNGNRIEVEYVTGSGKIRRVDDTLGPLAVLTYDASGFLEYIENYGKPRRKIYFTYEDASLAPAFTLTSQPPIEEKFLTEIMFSWSWPARDLKQSLTYNSYGEITQIDNVVQDYDYVCDPLCEWDPGDRSTRTLETYQYETREFYDSTHSSVEERLVKKQTRKIHNLGSTLSRDLWIGYTVDGGKSNPSQTKVTDLRGRTAYDFHFTSGGRDWTDGLMTQVKRKSLRGVTLHTQDTTWTQDNPASTVLENPRVSTQTNTLENGLSTSVDFTYLIDGTGNVKEVVLNGFNEALLRKTVYSYVHETIPTYDTLHLTNLVESVEVQDRQGNPLSLDSYGYDETALTDYPSLNHHDPAYDYTFTIRGNRTSTSHYLTEESRWVTSHSEYDIAGNVVKTIDSMKRETTMTYESDWHYSLLASTTNNLNHTTRFQWRTYRATIDGLSGQTYAPGEPKSVTDPNGVVVSTTSFDTLGRMTQQQTPVDTRDFRYGDLMYLKTVSTGSGYQYGTSGTGGSVIETQESDPTGANIVSSRQFDLGGYTSWKVPHRSGTAGATGTQTYDALGRVTQIRPPGGGGTTYTYHGNEVTLTHGGHDKLYTYGELGQIISIMEEDDLGVLGIETIYHHDGLGRLTQTTQGLQIRTFVYDSLGRLISETHPENGTTTHTYYDDGKLKTSTDALGVVLTLTYDGLGRPTTKTFSDTTPSVTFNYDETTTAEIPTITNSVGRMTSTWTSDNVGYTWSYDEVGRAVQHVASIDGTNYPTTYDYEDEEGCGCPTKDLRQIVYPNGFKIDYEHDAIGRILEVKAPVTPGFNSSEHRYVKDVEYGGRAGQATMIEFGTNVRRTVNYDSAGKLTSIQARQYDYLGFPYPSGTAVAGWPYQKWDYTYSQARIQAIVQKKQISANGKIWENKYRYTYDEWHRLDTTKREDRENFGNWRTTYQFDFQYDRYNNLTKRQKLVGSGATWTFAVDNTTNRVTSRTGGTARSYYYNDAGQVTSDTLRNFTYTYDGANRLTRVDTSTTNKGTYRYDAFGRRVTKNPGEVIYVYGAQGELLLEDREGSADPKTVYHIQMQGKLIATRTKGASEDKVRLFHRNHLGDIKATDTVDLNYQYQYRQYCSTWWSYQACHSLTFDTYDIPFAAHEDDQFQGHDYDAETFLNYMGARFYNPDLMRWMSPDPVTQLSPADMNRYTYVRNDPVTHVDPSGMYAYPCPWWDPFCDTDIFDNTRNRREMWNRPQSGEGEGGWIEDFYERKCADVNESVSNLGVSSSQWFELTRNQQANLLNIIAGLKWAGLPLDGVSVAWEGQVIGKPVGEMKSLGITDERVFFEFADTSVARAWMDTITNSPAPSFPSYKGQDALLTVLGHETGFINSYKADLGSGSFQVTFNPFQRHLVDVDIDPNNSFFGHLGDVLAPGPTDPFKAAERLREEFVSPRHECLRYISP